MIKEDLYLTIRLDELKRIVSGEKTEEYRANKEYYHKVFKTLDDNSVVTEPSIKIIKFRGGLNYSKYAYVSVKFIRYEQFFGETKPIPENFEKGDIAYVVHIGEVLDHNL